MSLNKFSDENTGFDLKLNVGADAVKCNTIEADTLNVSNLTTETLEATTSIETPQGNITNVESTNINTTTINGQEYPQRQAPATSIFSLDMNLGTYDPLFINPNSSPPFPKGGVDYMNLSVATGLNLDIATIEGGNYNGQKIRIMNPQSGSGQITIKYNSGLANPSAGKFAIITNGFADKVLLPVSPSVMNWCELVYVENYAGAGVNYWVCSNVLS